MTKIAISSSFLSESVAGGSSLAKQWNRPSPPSRHGDSHAVVETLRRSFVPAADSPGTASRDVGKCWRGPFDRDEATTLRAANCTTGGRHSSSPIGHRDCNPSRHMTPPGSVRERTGSDTYCGAEAA